MEPRRPASNDIQKHNIKLLIDGMTCSNCVSHVDSALTSLDAVHETMVTLRPEKTSEVIITLNSDISDDELTDAIDDAGYTLAGIERR